MKTQISLVEYFVIIFSKSHNDFRRNRKKMTVALELIGAFLETFEAI